MEGGGAGTERNGPEGTPHPRTVFCTRERDNYGVTSDEDNDEDNDDDEDDNDDDNDETTTTTTTTIEVSSFLFCFIDILLISTTKIPDLP